MKKSGKFWARFGLDWLDFGLSETEIELIFVRTLAIEPLSKVVQPILVICMHTKFQWNWIEPCEIPECDEHLIFGPYSWI